MATKVLKAGLTLQLFENSLLLGLVLDKPHVAGMIGVFHDLEFIDAVFRGSLYDLDVVRDDLPVRRSLATRVVVSHAVSNADAELMLLLGGVPRLLFFGKLNAD